MEYGNTQTSARRIEPVAFIEFDGDDEFVRQRLDWFLEANAKTAFEKSMFLSEREKIEALLMKNPLSIEKTFAYFGLLLGLFPPAALFLRYFIEAGVFQSRDIWILGVTAVVVLVSTVVGWFSGKFIANIVFKLEKMSWSKMLAALPFVGIFWGIMAGGAGGAVIFGIGAFFGAIIGGAVGAFALLIFTIFHRLMKRGGEIELKHFLPLAFGVAFIISAFFLGLRL